MEEEFCLGCGHIYSKAELCLLSTVLAFIILSSNGKKINIINTGIENCSIIGKILFAIAIITIGFCFKNEHGIYLIIAKGLTFNMFWLLAVFLVFCAFLM